MRLTRNIVKWSSLLLLFFNILLLFVGILMRGMTHRSPEPTIGSVVMEIAPALFFFSYIFWLTASRRFQTLRISAGIIAVGWIVCWMAFSKSFPSPSDSAFWFWAGMFAPFVLYWLWVVSFARKIYDFTQSKQP
jgi:hypothetical protein